MLASSIEFVLHFLMPICCCERVWLHATNTVCIPVEVISMLVRWYPLHMLLIVTLTYLTLVLLALAHMLGAHAC